MLGVPLLMLCGLCVGDVVQGSASELQVRVNRMHLHSAAVTAQSAAEHVEYAYAAGDRADVWCLHWGAACDLTLTYHFLNQRDGDIATISDNATVTNTPYSWWAVGMRATLRAAHHGSRVTCQCTRNKLLPAIHVTFVQRETFYNVLEVKVNSEMLRYQTNSRAHSAYRLSYAYKQNEVVTVECTTNATDAVVHMYRHNVTHKPLPDAKLTLSPGELPTSKLTRLICVARDNMLTLLRNITLYLSPFYFAIDVSDPTPLTMNTSGSFLELYQPRREQQIFYEYHDGDTLYLNCSTLAGALLKYNYALVFGDTVQWSNDAIVTHIQLSSWDDNRTLNCSLINKSDNVKVRSICVYFQRKSITSSSRVEAIRADNRAEKAVSILPASPSSKKSDVAVAAGAAAAALVLTTLAAALCWCRALRHKRAIIAAAGTTALCTLDTDKTPHKLEIEATRASSPSRPLPLAPSKRISNEYVYTNNVYCEIPESQLPATTEESGAGGAYDYVHCHSLTNRGSSIVPPSDVSEDTSKIYDYAYCGHS